MQYLRPLAENKNKQNCSKHFYCGRFDEEDMKIKSYTVDLLGKR
jgi:hypothetical protein